MLNEEIRRKIDDCRNILLVKLPIPTDQVKQITLALIYKFMDDMDKAEVDLGGKPTFFAGANSKYAWKEIIKPSLAGPERVKLYNDGLEKISQNPGINPLYQEIFKDAYLPFKDPDVLFLFLKTIDWFKYEQNGDIGDAFEYLLKTMGAQGNAGQFLTPRHIIDFIVDCVNPTKEDTILDPACGTGGFLISAYNHIKKQNTDKKPWDLLKIQTGRTDIAKNITGFDISHDMVRLSSVNLFLHKFPNPNIYEYDTLVDESKWDDKYSCILANPPFMTPKGGIKPHDRFQIEANRAEVLFVDYILEHLKTNGKAGIIVPEGIIFQSANAYVALRKMALDNGLYAVVSLPSGVFNPYSGVKTSILLIDKSLKTKDVLFVKINNDGKDLGAQRRNIEANDIDQATELIKRYKEFLKEGKKFKLSGNDFVLANLTEKKKIEENDLNLSAERYKENILFGHTDWEMVELGHACDLESGSRDKGGARPFGVPSIGGEQINEEGHIRYDKMKFISENHFKSMSKGKIKMGDVLLVKDGATTGKTGFFNNPTYQQAAVNEHVFILRAKEKTIPSYLFYIIRSNAFQQQLKKFIKGIIGGISLEIKSIKIPLPPLDIQKKIVEELEGYQKIIDGAQKIIDNWKPHLTVNNNWKKCKLSEVCDVRDGTHDSPKFTNKGYPLITSKNLVNGEIDFANVNLISKNDYDSINKRSRVDDGDVLFAMIGTIGNPVLVQKDRDFAIKNVALFKIGKDNKHLTSAYLKLILDLASTDLNRKAVGATQKFVSLELLRNYEVLLPSLQEQEEIVKNVSAQYNTIKDIKTLANMKKIDINNKVSEIWGK